MEQHSKYIEATSKIPTTRKEVKFERYPSPTYNNHISIHDQDKDKFLKSSCIYPDPRSTNGLDYKFTIQQTTRLSTEQVNAIDGD